MTGSDLDKESATEWYVVVEEIADRGLAAQACQAVLDIVKPRATRALVDAYTDYRKMMPPEVQAAEAALHAKGKLQHKGDPGMNVKLDLSLVQDWDLLARYAPWSINIDLYDTNEEIAILHDCGHDISARLSPHEATRLSAHLADDLHIETLDDFKARPAGR